MEKIKIDAELIEFVIINLGNGYSQRKIIKICDIEAYEIRMDGVNEENRG